MARTIQSPGVEIKEVDLSLRPNLPVGTTVFIPGFARQGPTDELLTVSSLSEFEQIYGLPQNAAERYMYHTVKAVFQSPANVLVSRLPYGLGAGTTVADKYSVQVYPVIPRPIMVDGAQPKINTVAKDPRIIAWHPADDNDVDAGGDYVLAKAASGDLVDYVGGALINDALEIVTNEASGELNGTQIIVTTGGTENVTEYDGEKFIITRTASRLTGSQVAEAINNNVELSEYLTAAKGNADLPGTATFAHDGVDVVVNTVAIGDKGDVTLTGDDGQNSIATGTGDQLSVGNTTDAYDVRAVVAGAAGDVTLTGKFGADGVTPLTLQELVDEHNVANPDNLLTVATGGEHFVADGQIVSLTGGVEPKTIDQLIADHNAINTADHQLVLADATQGSSLLSAATTLTLRGSDAQDAVISQSSTITLKGGVTYGLSKKVIPTGEWRFGTENPGGYIGTTLKDAVDSVAAAIPSLSAYSQNDLMWKEEVAGDPLSIPALKAYEHPEIADLVAAAVNSVGWDLSASDRYYLGEPSNIELDDSNFQKTIKGEVKLSQANAGKLENQKFYSYDDLLTKGGAGLIIVNDKKFVINEKFEGYYVGISDNTNLNPATDFDAVGKLKSLSKKLGGTTGGYVEVPDNSAGTKSRLTFSLSAGFIFDQFGNKQQVGLDGSMSEVLENLAEFDLNTDEFSDVLSLAVFKVRQSTLEPDATKLDYLVADSVIGSVNYFREAFKSDGGTAVSYFIESEATNSNNLYLKINEGISKHAGNWLDETGYPTRKIRILPAKDVRYYDEKSATEQAALAGRDEAEKREVNDFKVSQAFLNGAEEVEDRLYIKSWQGLQRSGKAQVKHGNNVYPHGVYQEQRAEAKETGNIPSKLDRIFELADNFDLFPIDITVEGGLGTIFVGTSGGKADLFDDEEYFNIGDHVVSSTGLSGKGLYTTKIIDNRNEIDYLVNYDTIFDTFKSFSQFQRKDNIFVADPLRYIFVQGRNSKTLTSKQREAGVNFSQHIYWPLRHMMTGGTKNSSYCTTYANWGFTNDKALNRAVWVPMSGFAAAAMGNTDSNFYPWIAPAGFTRGLVSGIADLAFYPKQKERDQLYKIGLNPIANFPNEGFAIFGQKTMQAKPSAFDRINVRRLFLYLQKATMNTIKYFVFEPNTLFTRTQVLNVLRPIFEEVKNTQGMYDYLLVCDERNNSPDVIDRNELVVDIYIKPTRAAEFILVNFYATRTGQDFSELVA